MTQSLITYDNKSNRVPVSQRDEQVVAEDLNEIKTVVNDNASDAEGRFVTADGIDIADNGKVFSFQERDEDTGQLGKKYLLPSFNFGSIPPNYENSNWVIRYQYDLGSATIVLPAGVTLEFDGGSFTNGTIQGNDTKIKAGIEQVFHEGNLLVSGTWDVPYSLPEWFGGKGDANVDTGTGTDNYIPITRAYKISNTIKLSDSGVYGVEQSLLFENDVTFITDNATILGIPFTTGPRTIIIAGVQSQDLSNNSPLTADSLKNSNRIDLAQSFIDTLEVGEVILINSDKEYIGEEVALDIFYAGELIRVQTKETGYITTAGNTNDSYTTADNAKVTKIQMTKFDIIGQLNITHIDNNVAGGACLDLKWVKDSKLNINPYSKTDEVYGINANSCYNLDINTRLFTGEDGIAINGACKNIKITGNLEGFGQLITCAVGRNEVGLIWNVDISDAIFNSRGKCIDAHFGTGSISVKDCEISGGSGIGIFAQYNTITDCNIHVRTEGIRTRYPIDNPFMTVDSFIVRNCNIDVADATATRGVYMYSNHVEYMEITNTRIKYPLNKPAIDIGSETRFGEFKFDGNDLSGSFGMIMNGANIIMPEKIKINNCKVDSTGGSGFYFGDDNNVVDYYTNTKIIALNNCEILGDEAIVLFTGAAALKTLDTLTINKLITNCDDEAIKVQNISINELNIINTESEGSTSFFVYLYDLTTKNTTVNTVFVTGTNTVSSRLIRGTASAKVNKVIVGQNRLSSNNLVHPDNLPAGYLEVLSCANENDGYAYRGYGSPEGVVTADPGSFYLNINGGAGTTFYVKESGTLTTGWIAK